jgi:hypothetical protein
MALHRRTSRDDQGEERNSSYRSIIVGMVYFHWMSVACQRVDGPSRDPDPEVSDCQMEQNHNRSPYPTQYTHYSSIMTKTGLAWFPARTQRRQHQQHDIWPIRIVSHHFGLPVKITSQNMGNSFLTEIVGPSNRWPNMQQI